MTATADLKFEETEPDADEASLDVRYEITSFPTDFTVKVMHQKWTDGQLTIPDFQRRYVWNRPQASRLIESFLLGLPIPQVFLYRERSTPKLLVVDGHQRLATIAMFYDGTFTRDRTFRLIGVDRRWDGKSYRDLSEDDRLSLDDSTLRAIVIQQTRPDDNSSVYQIFERLNTGGSQLSPMEIRKAIFHGQAYDFVERLNTSEHWRQLIGNPAVDKRLRDVELVARTLALAQSWQEYKAPMKQFITDYMAVLAGLDERRLGRLERRFRRACETLAVTLGPQPFHLRKRLNVAALDVVVACAVFLGPKLDGNLQQKYDGLKLDEVFVRSVGQHTSDKDAVLERFSLVHRALGA